jgi:hypothetical protein
MNKRGLSAIITTLLIVVLVLVAIGIVWGVIRNVIMGGVGNIELSAKCLNINVRATAINCNDPEACVVRLTRTGSDESEIGGVKLVFFEGTDNSGVIDVNDVPNLGGDIEKLAGKTISGIDSNLASPDSVKVTPYFIDESGKEQLCAQTSFSNLGSGGDDIGDDGGVCGDGNCDAGEDCSSCEADCGVCEDPNCGDGNCDATESCSSCEADCGVCSEEYCGDEECNNDETCETCERDCSCTIGPFLHCLEGSCVECLDDENCGEGYYCGEDNVCHEDECIPIILDCVSEGVECGIIYDDCGDQIDCEAELGDCVAQYDETYFCNGENMCEAQTYIVEGEIDNVWPVGSGMYFDDSELEQIDGLYWSKAIYFPDEEFNECFLIKEYVYDVEIYEPSVIVQLWLTESLPIVADDVYQIWEPGDCDDMLDTLPA